MRIVRVLASLALALAAWQGPAANPVPARAGADEVELRSLELELNEALARRNVRRASELLIDDWLLTTSNGQLKTKADVIAEISLPALVFEANEVTGVKVRIWGDTAVLTGVLRQRYRLNGQLADVRMRYTDTWVRMGSAWRQASGHASRLDSDQPA